MIILEKEINRLKTLYMEMHEVVRGQVRFTRDALEANDADIAIEVLRNEGRVNFYENTIDRECEDFLALHRPVASDLRLTIAVLKMSGNLERIGDHAYRICSYLSDKELLLNKKILEQIKLIELFDVIDMMMVNASVSFEKKDVKLAQLVFKQDKTLDKVNKKIPRLMEKFAKKHKEEPISNLVQISRVVGKLERMGDLIKNISEEIIFYIESSNIKHEKKNKKIRKRFKSVNH
jgi:phosphate transport system protein